jgi:hypothetical protein
MEPRSRPEALRRFALLLALGLVVAGCSEKGGGTGDPGPAAGSGGRGGGTGAGKGGASGSGSGSGGAGGTTSPPGSGGAGPGGSGGAPALPPDASAGDDVGTIDAAVTADGGGGGIPGDAGTGGAAGGPGNGAAPLGTRVDLDPAVSARWVGTRRTVSMEGGSKIFTAGFEAGKFGGGGNGHIIRFPIVPGREYLFEYRLRFDAGFDFSRGGKIPGLSGASSPSGCDASDGTGFTARQMWREQGRLIGYIYDMDQSTECGNAIATGFNFAVGRWYSIKQRIKLNTGRNHDGVLQLWVDDRQVINRSNMGWMVEAPDRMIDEVMLDFFFGGSTADWSPSRNCTLSFGDLYLTRVAE